MSQDYTTASSPSTTASQLAGLGPWVTLDVAAKLVGKARNTIKRYVNKGVLRAFDGRPMYVSTEDLVYMNGRLKAKATPLPLGARGLAPSETYSLGLSGVEIYNRAIETHDTRLVLPPPADFRSADVAPPGLELDRIRAEMAGMKVIMRSLVQNQVGGEVRQPDVLTDEDVYFTLQRAVHDLTTPFSVDKSRRWLTLLLTVDHHWLRRVREWANEHQEAAQEICGAEIVPYAPLLRIADCIKRFARFADDGSIELVTLHRRASSTWEHMNTLFYAALVEEQMLYTEGVRTTPPGTSPTDQYILSRLRGEESG